MELALVCITIGYVFGCIVGFIGGRFIQKKDVEKFKADYHELCRLKDMRIQRLENENKTAKEIINEFIRISAASCEEFEPEFSELIKRAEDFVNKEQDK